MTTKFIKVKAHSRATGKRCMHCGRPAVVTATRVQREEGRQFRLAVWYCAEHAEHRGVTKLLREGQS